MVGLGERLLFKEARERVMATATTAKDVAERYGTDDEYLEKPGADIHRKTSCPDDRWETYLMVKWCQWRQSISSNAKRMR